MFCFWGFLKYILLYSSEGCIVVGTVVAARLMAYKEGPLCSHTTQTFLSISPFNFPRTTSHFLSTICFCCFFCTYSICLHILIHLSFILHILHVYSIVFFIHSFIYSLHYLLSIFCTICFTLLYTLLNLYLYQCEDVPRVPDHMLIRTSKDL